MTANTTDPSPLIEEPGVEPVGTQPVEPGAAAPRPTPSTGRARRGRWVVALVVVALLAATTLGGAVLLAGARADSTVSRWAPADAVAYVEIRADLPGDQRQALGDFLSAFPGFADQSTLDRKLDELYGRLVQAATEGRQSWSADIAPWFGGQLGAAAGPLPAAETLKDPASLEAGGRGLMIATTTDPAKATGWVKATAEEAGRTVQTIDANGTQLLLIGSPARPVVAAATADVLLVGDETSVKAALTRAGAGGIATDAGFQEAIRGLTDQQVALGYVDTGAIGAWLRALPAASDAGIPSAALDALPAWVSGGLRVESDALSIEGLAPRTTRSSNVDDARSRLPGLLPETTIALAETHDLDAALTAATAGDAASTKQLEQLLKPVGGLDGLLGWAGETGVAVLERDGAALPGVVAIPKDATKAADLGRSLKNLATLAGLAPTEETVDGVTVVSVDVGSLAGGTGSTRPTEPMVVSWAATKDLVVVGRGPEFVKAVLAAPSGRSLADVDRFKQAVDRAGASHQSLAWVDLDAVERIAVAGATPAERATFDREIRPYLTPLGTFVATTARDGDLERSHALLVLDQ